MAIRFTDYAGQQIELSINEFAEALSIGDVSGLCYSYYDHSHHLNGKPTGTAEGDYHQGVCKPKFTKLAKHVRGLPEVTSTFEFYIAWTPDWESDEFVDLSFTRQGDKVLVEIH